MSEDIKVTGSQLLAAKLQQITGQEYKPEDVVSAFEEYLGDDKEVNGNKFNDFIYENYASYSQYFSKYGDKYDEANTAEFFELRDYIAGLDGENNFSLDDLTKEIDNLPEQYANLVNTPAQTTQTSEVEEADEAEETQETEEADIDSVSAEPKNVFEGAAAEQIEIDDDGNYYITTGTYGSGDQSFTTLSNILQNVYGVDYSSAEGQQILAQLKQDPANSAFFASGNDNIIYANAKLTLALPEGVVNPEGAEEEASSDASGVPTLDEYTGSNYDLSEYDFSNLSVEEKQQLADTLNLWDSYGLAQDSDIVQAILNGAKTDEFAGGPEDACWMDTDGNYYNREGAKIGERVGLDGYTGSNYNLDAYDFSNLSEEERAQLADTLNLWDSYGLAQNSDLVTAVINGAKTDEFAGGPEDACWMDTDGNFYDRDGNKIATSDDNAEAGTSGAATETEATETTATSTAYDSALSAINERFTSEGSLSNGASIDDVKNDVNQYIINNSNLSAQDKINLLATVSSYSIVQANPITVSDEAYMNLISSTTTASEMATMALAINALAGGSNVFAEQQSNQGLTAFNDRRVAIMNQFINVLDGADTNEIAVLNEIFDLNSIAGFSNSQATEQEAQWMEQIIPKLTDSNYAALDDALDLKNGLKTTSRPSVGVASSNAMDSLVDICVNNPNLGAKLCVRLDATSALKAMSSANQKAILDKMISYIPNADSTTVAAFESMAGIRGGKSYLAGMVQDLYSGSAETEKLAQLYKAVYDSSNSASWYTQYAASHQGQFNDVSCSKDSLEKVVHNIQAGNVYASALDIKFALLKACGNDPAQLATWLRDINFKGNDDSAEEEWMPYILELIGQDF